MELPQWAPAVAAIVALIGVAATYVRTRPAMKLASVQGEAALWLEINKIKDDASNERKACDERIARLDERHLQAVATLRAEFNADLSLLRHDRNNLRQVLNYILIRIKKIDHPELQELAGEAEEMLTRGENTLALERGAQKAVM